MDEEVKICRDCRHYRDSQSGSTCRHQMNLRTDYVNGGISTRNSADFLRSDATRCGPQGKWFEERAK